jgi:ribonuclease Z
MIGKGADVLIHEATFNDDREHDAKSKKHSTVGEAVTIAKHMDCKAVILTHFSQRYSVRHCVARGLCFAPLLQTC